MVLNSSLCLDLVVWKVLWEDLTFCCEQQQQCFAAGHVLVSLWRCFISVMFSEGFEEPRAPFCTHTP